MRKLTREDKRHRSGKRERSNILQLYTYEWFIETVRFNVHTHMNVYEDDYGIVICLRNEREFSK